MSDDADTLFAGAALLVVAGFILTGLLILALAWLMLSRGIAQADYKAMLQEAEQSFRAAYAAARELDGSNLPDDPIVQGIFGNISWMQKGDDDNWMLTAIFGDV